MATTVKTQSGPHLITQAGAPGRPLNFRPLWVLGSSWPRCRSYSRKNLLSRINPGAGIPNPARDSASTPFRAVDVDLAAYPMLAWRWYIELPINSPLDERTREGAPGAAVFFGS
jgi:hypothetical protein